MRRSITLLVHYPRFGAYHVARLNAASRELKPAGIKVVGMEIAKILDSYERDPDSDRVFESFVALPGKVYERSSALEIWRGVSTVLDKIKPDAIAICGYSSRDAWSALAWCSLYRRKAILLSDSKYDDAPRLGWKECLKRTLIRRFDAALCAGKASRIYLEHLGMKSQQIFEGADVVDNDFFWQGAEQARRSPERYRSAPGLDCDEPFFLASTRFIRRKNVDGVLRAYGEYRSRFDNVSDDRLPWRLVILGDGPQRGILENLVQSHKIEGVSFPGFFQIDKLPAYYGLAGVFIHPPHRDQWGLVVNEAMAAGLPVLVSSGSGCAQDLVSEGNNGFIFASHDTGTLADLMMRVSSDQVDLKAMGVNSRSLIEDWGLRRFAHGLYGALQAALKSR